MHAKCTAHFSLLSTQISLFICTSRLSLTSAGGWVGSVRVAVSRHLCDDRLSAGHSGGLVHTHSLMKVDNKTAVWWLRNDWRSAPPLAYCEENTPILEQANSLALLAAVASVAVPVGSLPQQRSSRLKVVNLAVDVTKQLSAITVLGQWRVSLVIKRKYSLTV